LGLFVFVGKSFLVVAAVPLAVTLSNPSTDVDSSLEIVPTMYVPEGVDKNDNRIEDLLEDEIE
jgi:hypothetical protein